MGCRCANIPTDRHRQQQNTNSYFVLSEKAKAKINRIRSGDSDLDLFSLSHQLLFTRTNQILVLIGNQSSKCVLVSDSDGQPYPYSMMFHIHESANNLRRDEWLLCYTLRHGADELTSDAWTEPKIIVNIYVCGRCVFVACRMGGYIHRAASNANLLLLPNDWPVNG